MGTQTFETNQNIILLTNDFYRELKKTFSEQDEDLIRYTLQISIVLFAESKGLLPTKAFGQFLYTGKTNGAVEDFIKRYFKEVTSEKLENRTLPYLNLSLLQNFTAISLTDNAYQLLLELVEADWTHTDLHVLGGIFQKIMCTEERHSSGAHYTALEDIMRVVGPTILEPWRNRMNPDLSLRQMKEIQLELSKFRVLDPACGSGNFLFVAFQELYKLETVLLTRMHEYLSMAKEQDSWGSVVHTTNFFGIDINPFAVELAKTTLNIAKKIAFEERKEHVAEVYGQMGRGPLPLDNLDTNIVCVDALFVQWPKVEVIVGNPPFLGGLKIRKKLGVEYLRALQKRYPDVNGRADFCAYWFRRAHDHLDSGQRAGLVATNSIREGNTRVAATDYIIDNGGSIFNAVSSQDWPGDAVVKVSMVNWIKGPSPKPARLMIDGCAHVRDNILSHLQLHADVRLRKSLSANSEGTSQGVVLGTKAFQISQETALELNQDETAGAFIQPIAVGQHLMRGRLTKKPDYMINMSMCSTIQQAQQGGAAFEYINKHVWPVIQGKTGKDYETWLARWWQPARPRAKFFRTTPKNRLLACSRHAARPIFVFLSMKFVPTDSLQLFALDDDYSFGILQSQIHWCWAKVVGSKIKSDTRYTSDVWSTFPWPPEPSEEMIAKVSHAGRKLREVRSNLMVANDGSLRELYQNAEVEGPHPLKAAQAALDKAVAAAYGIPSWQETTEFLLELNQCYAEDEKESHPIQGPGLPTGLDPKDPRWFSTDCIKPPPLEIS